MPRLLSTSDLADYFEISVVSFRMRLARGQAPKPSIKKGNRYFWTEKDVADFLEGLSKEGDE